MQNTIGKIVNSWRVEGLMPKKSLKNLEIINKQKAERNAPIESTKKMALGLLIK
jgi:hypothetical protein